MTIRHPEKVHRQTNPIPKKPHWIRVKAPTSNLFNQTRDIVKKNKAHHQSLLKCVKFINNLN